MSEPSPRLVLYTRILAKSRSMHELAGVAEWDELVDEELARRELIGELRRLLENSAAAGDEENRQAEALIRETLKLDEETRALAEKWMAEIDQRLLSVQTSRRLQNTYLSP